MPTDQPNPASTAIDPELVAAYRDRIGPALRSLRARIDQADRFRRGVRLVAVTKAHPVEAVVAAAELGLRTFGENYAQELAGKAKIVEGIVDGPIEWHFIGQLQTNKVRLIADRVSCWQSVDRPKVGAEIAKRAPGAAVLAQLNLSADPAKAGCSFDEIDGLIEDLRARNLDVTGLMGVGTAADDAATRAGFARLAAVADDHDLAVRSMGMTADLEAAIAAGSTMVRVGSALFGPRVDPNPA